MYLERSCGLVLPVRTPQIIHWGDARPMQHISNKPELDREGAWPILATTTAELRRAGPLAPVWRRLDENEPPCSLAALPGAFRVVPPPSEGGPSGGPDGGA